MATDAAIELRFDRFLLPSTAVRQSIAVSTGNAGVFLVPYYDPNERVVIYRLPRGGSWVPGVRYTVELLHAEENAYGWGFRAIDGAELAPDGPVPLRFTFRIRREPGDPSPPAPAVPAGSEALSVLQRGGCAAASCHAADDGCVPAASSPCGAPRVGLDLTTAEGIADTALGVVAHETDLGPEAGEVQLGADPLGLGMPRIDPASPGNSYLLYKLLANDRFSAGADPCATRYNAPVPADCAAASHAEIQRLRATLVRGAPMPLGPDGPRERLDDADLATLVDWIAGGAPLE